MAAMGLGLDLRPVTEEEFSAYARSVDGAFGGGGTDEQIEVWRRVVELDRTLAAFDAGQVVGTAGAWSLELTLPGLTSVPAAGVTAVSVAPTHRRQGVLTGMMARLLDDVAARGEPIAILLASESVIYGRFGYGWATSRASVDLETRHSALAVASGAGGRMRRIQQDAAGKILPDLHERIRLTQPGDITRLPGMWEYDLADVDPEDKGKPPRFWAVHENDSGEPDGYVQYRFDHNWDHGLANNVLQVADLAGVSPDVEAALWEYVLCIDLVSRVRVNYRPIDEPFKRRLVDPRRLRTLATTDHIWVRLVDVPAALAGRSYSTEDAVVFEVHDAFRPANDGRYEVSGGGARRVRSKADVALSVADLAACFLGGVSFSHLARAGRVEERKPGGLRRADLLFASDPPPFCRTDF